MKKNSNNGLVISFLIILLLLLILGIFRESPTYDEVTHVLAGYGFLTTHDFRLEPFNPAFSRELMAIPLLFAKKLGIIILYPRLIIVFLTLLLGIVVYHFTKHIYGKKEAVFALFLFIFEPEILANGHYATTDTPFTFFYILSLFTYVLFKRKFTYKKMALFSILVGLTFALKTSAIPFICFTFFLFFIFEKKKSRVASLTYWKKHFLFLIIFFLFSTVSIWATYFFSFEPMLGYRFDTHRKAIELAKQSTFIHFALTQPLPLGSYISTIKQTLLLNYTDIFQRKSFFFGRISNNGFYGYYFPILLFIKTPLPLLIFFFLSVFFCFRKTTNDSLPLIAIFAILLSVFFSRVLLVLRYILPLYPLMCVYASKVVKKALRNSIFFVFVTLLSIWYVAGTMTVYPHYISFFNELVGGEKNGYKYLVDSNFDWGQGLIDLAFYQKEKMTETLQLAYFGSAVPSDYGIMYSRIKDESINDKKKIDALHKNSSIAISATCWYFCGYYKNPLFKNKKPTEIIGGSILLFNGVY